MMKFKSGDYIISKDGDYEKPGLIAIVVSVPGQKIYDTFFYVDASEGMNIKMLQPRNRERTWSYQNSWKLLSKERLALIKLKQ